MNKDTAAAQWEQLKAQAKKVWGELTDDDFLQAEGSATHLYATIERRFGETKEKILSKLERLKS